MSILTTRCLRSTFRHNTGWLRLMWRRVTSRAGSGGE
jgi:hypothetical protein